METIAFFTNSGRSQQFPSCAEGYGTAIQFWAFRTLLPAPEQLLQRHTRTGQLGATQESKKLNVFKILYSPIQWQNEIIWDKPVQSCWTTSLRLFKQICSNITKTGKTDSGRVRRYLNNFVRTPQSWVTIHLRFTGRCSHHTAFSGRCLPATFTNSACYKQTRSLACKIPELDAYFGFKSESQQDFYWPSQPNSHLKMTFLPSHFCLHV